MSSQKKYIIIQIVLALIFITGVAILFLGPELLLDPIIDNGKLPIGNLISWIVLAVLPTFFFQWFRWKYRKNSLQKIMVSIAIILGVSWGLFSFKLTGNWQFKFANGSYFIVWIVYTATIIFLPLIATLIHVISSIKRK